MRVYFIYLLFLIVNLTYSLDAHPKEDEVFVLTDDTIEEALTLYPNLLIEFYAPWCPHCQELLPEFDKSAMHLQSNSTIPIKLGKMDITINKKTAEKYNIQGIPNIKLFSNGTYEEFPARTKDHMIKWLNMKYVTPLNIVSEEDIKVFKNSTQISMVYYGSNEEDINRIKHYALKDLSQDFYIYSTKGKKEIKYDDKQRSLILYKPYDERISTLKGPFTSDSIRDFIALHSYPIVIDDFKMGISYLLASNNEPVLFFIRDPTDTKLDSAFTKVAHKRKKDVQSVMAYSKGETEEKVFKALKIGLDVTPIVVIVSLVKGNFKTYNITANITESSVNKFIDDYIAGTLPVDLMSEDIPTEQAGPVYRLVSKSFQLEVLDNDMDVLVKFYQPWCGHCKKLAPIYEELAKKLKDNKKLRIADFDMSKNDFDLYPIDGYPTILFYKGSKKNEPVVFDGPREVEDFEKFLTKEASHPITIPKTNSNKTDEL